jgi:hypothetical protein
MPCHHLTSPHHHHNHHHHLHPTRSDTPTPPHRQGHPNPSRPLLPPNAHCLEGHLRFSPRSAIRAGRRSITRPPAHLCTPRARSRALVAPSHRPQAQYSCRSTLPNANDWTRLVGSRLPHHPLTSSPKRADTQRRSFTRARPPRRPILR